MDDCEYIKALGRYLRGLRQGKKLKLRDVEKSTGIPDSWLAQFETGVNKRIPTPSRLRKLAKLYSVTMKDLLEKAGYIDDIDIKGLEKNND